MSKDPLAVYIHWPFCQTICPYCDFNVHTATAIDQDAWRAALLSELDHYAEETAGREVGSIYFGGGTPSLMPPETAAAVIQHIGTTWPIIDDIEITLESNPTSSETARLGAFQAVGVNRVSIGVQSFDDDELRFLGRDHSGVAARAAIETAQQLFGRVTFDLIYALAGQTPEGWRETLADAVAMGTGHLSLYQLTIESGTAFMRDGITGADDDLAADLYEITQDVLSAAGMPAYEISNHAKPGEESRHNLHTWRGGDYIGIGPGAHGRLNHAGGTVATHQIHTPARWLEKVQNAGHGTAKRRPLGAADRAREMMMMGLRTRDGVDVSTVEAKSGCPRDVFLDAAALGYIVDGGLLSTANGRLCAADAGRAKLNAILAEILVF